jgi:hypothetical protein
VIKLLINQERPVVGGVPLFVGAVGIDLNADVATREMNDESSLGSQRLRRYKATGTSSVKAFVAAKAYLNG